MFLSALTAKDHEALLLLEDCSCNGADIESNYDAVPHYFERPAYQHDAFTDLQIEHCFFESIGMKLHYDMVRFCRIPGNKVLCSWKFWHEEWFRDGCLLWDIWKLRTAFLMVLEYSVIPRRFPAVAMMSMSIKNPEPPFHLSFVTSVVWAS